MIRIAASRILSFGTLGRRQLSTKGFQNWLLTTSADEQKSEEIEIPQTGISKPSERTSSTIKGGSAGAGVQKDGSSNSTSQLVKIDNFSPDSLDNPYSYKLKSDKKDEKQNIQNKSSSPPSASHDRSKNNEKSQTKSKKQSKDHKKKPKDEKPPSDGNNNSKEQMCSSHNSMVPPSDVLEQLKTFELQSKCTSFHMKSAGHDR
ncbi:uncharacterized G-patch domain protein DDB_G0278987-like [Chironomus tepperi]|uniref:uncharacterized G-patch domain protein DDB_G0278987-like n=1 Tax=Chironomus tepperi TaxID=113505 RepID=UPI00391F1F73